MHETIIILVAIAASLLTLVSGFGLGTLMLPVFALFFPLEVAVGMTAVVHLLNNVFKFALMYRHVDRKVLLWFGVPGILGAWVGAKLLMLLGHGPTLYMGIREGVDGLDLVIATLMVLFAITELLPHLAQFSFKRKYLVPGGMVSGFFGGLSGHQGALRTMFLLRAGLSKETFIGTGIAIALLIDLTRIPIYMQGLPAGILQERGLFLALVTIASFLGAYLGKRWITKITFRSVQLIVGAFMLLIALLLAAGVI